MKAYHYTIPNTDPWTICDTEIVVVVDNLFEAEKLLKESGELPAEHVFEPKNFVTLKRGVTVI